MTDEIFRYKAPDFAKLSGYGFRKEGDAYVFRTEIFEAQFSMTVRIFRDGAVKAELLDKLTEEPYTLHLVEEAAGEFVGRVRSEFERVLRDIADRCFEREVFKSAVTKDLIAHVREKYGNEPEYLWANFPDNAIWRRSDNGKWYGALMTVARGKLGLKEEGNMEILDVRADPSQIPLLTDGVHIFGGWHMNKKHWLTLPLDGRLSLEEIENFLEESYEIAGER